MKDFRKKFLVTAKYKEIAVDYPVGGGNSLERVKFHSFTSVLS